MSWEPPTKRGHLFVVLLHAHALQHSRRGELCAAWTGGRRLLAGSNGEGHKEAMPPRGAALPCSPQDAPPLRLLPCHRWEGYTETSWEPLSMLDEPLHTYRRAPGVKL